jgi:4-amino-4-deoxy-L-arabinose transferase-like glycosyltransferase
MPSSTALGVPVSSDPPDLEQPAATAAASGGFRSRILRVFLGRDGDPRWARPGFWALLIATAALYLINITSSGYANEFYAASVKSATKSWTALLFASLDSGLSITVDKPPAAIWIMGLSARIFGFSSASLLVPQALMGVATVALLYAAVRRVSGPGAGLVAGALAALTPVAALIFRFDNPDALLTLAMTAAAYMVVRALQSEKGRGALWWMVGAGALIGLAFMTKMLQGLLVLPALGLAYLLFSSRSLKARIGHLLAATGALIVSGGWLIALCAVWPAASRPYIGGSTNNSLWELALGYNGLGRIFGGGGNGGGSSTGFGGTAGILRMFNSSFATEVSWFLPAALLLLVAGFVYRGRAARTDGVRASLVIWGGWLLITGVVFSFMSGTIHPYYAVALVPAIAAVVAIGGRELFSHVSNGRPTGLIARGLIALTVAGTATWGFVLLNTYASSWLPAMKWVALIGGVGGAIMWFLFGILGTSLTWRRLAAGALIVASLSAVTPSAAWTVATAASAHSGSIPTSGPSVASNSGGMGGGGSAPSGGMGAASGQQGTPPSGDMGSGGQQGGMGGTPPSGDMGSGSQQGSSQQQGSSESTGGQPGGSSTSSSAELISLLNSAGTTWSAAVVGDQSAASLILNTDTAVYCIGGWSGSDNNISLDAFKALVASGQIHYFIASGQNSGGPGGDSTSASEITSWVTSTFTSTTVGSSTVYDLTATK